MASIGYLIINFGGPRNLKEVEPFLYALLKDRDVIRTKWPQFFHNLLFRNVARRRGKKVSADYAAIGGGSPIYSDTEHIAQALSKRLKAPVLTFHRYLEATHETALQQIEALRVNEIHVFPMFPQFTYATTGSVARLLSNHLSSKVLNKLLWVKSYSAHPAFIQTMQQKIRNFMNEHHLKEEETLLLFSAHGLPKSFIESGDLYEYECRSSFAKIMSAFPSAAGQLVYQSKFGPGEWLKPYTQDVCETIETERKNIVFVPVSFTSDHIETLFEVEKLYMPILAKRGLNPYRVPAMNRQNEWLDAIEEILKDFNPVNTSMLIRSSL
ncbi:MAG: ferrochelatase [Chlamydiales bacterium]